MTLQSMPETEAKPWMNDQLDHACRSESNRLHYKRPALSAIENRELDQTSADLETLYNRSGAYVGKENL